MKKLKKLKFNEANNVITEINTKLHLSGIEIVQQNYIPLQKDVPDIDKIVFVEWLFFNLPSKQINIINNLFELK